MPNSIVWVLGTDAMPGEAIAPRRSRRGDGCNSDYDMFVDAFGHIDNFVAIAALAPRLDESQGPAAQAGRLPSQLQRLHITGCL